MLSGRRTFRSFYRHENPAGVKDLSPDQRVICLKSARLFEDRTQASIGAIRAWNFSEISAATMAGIFSHGRNRAKLWQISHKRLQNIKDKG